ncbi:MAG: DUF2079 domain-containing protein [Bacteroides sp.]|nr:DUF2079 domain-containing protein [Bacteroides sp.]
MKDFLKKEPAQVAYRLLTAWITVSAFFMTTSEVDFTALDFFAGKSFILFIALTASVFLLFLFITSEKLVTLLMIGSALMYCVIAAARCSDFYFLLGCCAVISGIVCYSKAAELRPRLSKKALWVIAAVLMLLFTAIVGTACSLRYKNHWTPCYDFGIFAQMFYYMKETGRALVTCERDGLLSHFAVHFSPIFYLLLPIYLIFPSPVTLLLGQCAVTASGIVPLMKICGNHKLSPFSSLAFAAVYVLYYKCNFSLLVLSLVYFVCVTGLLSAYGDGVMTGRYDNYIYDEGGLFTVIKAAVQNPLYVVRQAASDKKISFILQMLVPLLFMPFCTKKAPRLILLIPFFLVNLMTNYTYQYNITVSFGEHSADRGILRS